HCDDSENAYLKVLCDNIFGREHFITNLIWRKKAGGANDSNDIAVEHEYILAYRKNKNGIYKIPLDAKTIASYKYDDEKIKTHGKYKIKDLNDPSLSDSSGLHYDINCPDGTILKASEHQWKCNIKTFKERLKDNRIIFKKVKDRWKVYYKIYLYEQRCKLVYDKDGNLIPRGRNLSSILYNVALNKDGTTDIKNLFGGEKPFSYPKPVKLLKTLIQSASKPGDIVLDFFAGSGTTGQAVLELNQEYRNRQFILIEQMDYINDVTVPRIVKSLDLYNSEDSFVYCELQLDGNSKVSYKSKTFTNKLYTL
ncbi:MAG: site-specific DNA-methyltransferase, partial [Candidatus Marinimicrobia bacterium]|nr:site-specific DNA-methyltransferase [Candidatus Neomarinimicrobiota bacterium]